MSRDSPGGPVVKTSPSNAGHVGLIPGPGAEIPHAWRPKKKQNIKYRNNIATDSIKDFLNGPHQKQKLFKK